MWRKRLIVLLGLLSSLLASAEVVPVPAVTAQLDQSIRLGAKVYPKVSVDVEAKSYALMTKMHVKVGQAVKKGQLLAEVELKFLNFRLENLQDNRAVALSEVKRAERDLRFEKNDVNRERQLAAKGILAESTVEATKISALQTEVQLARAKQKLIGFEQKIEEVKREIRDANFFSPIDGIVAKLAISPDELAGGFRLRMGMVVARIEEYKWYEARAFALDDQVVQLEIGDKVSVYFDGEATPLPGHVTDISAVVDPEDERKLRPVYELRVSFLKFGPPISSGRLCTLKLIRKAGPFRAVVPWNAVYLTEEGPRAWVFDQSADKWLARTLRLGKLGTHQVDIVEGIEPGEFVSAPLW